MSSLYAIDYLAIVDGSFHQPILREKETDYDYDDPDRGDLLLSSESTLNSIEFQSKILNQFPYSDTNEFSISGGDLSKFIFPYGLKLKYSYQKCFPVHESFSFVLTDENGRHMHASCLLFYEEIKSNELVEMQAAIQAITAVSIIQYYQHVYIINF